MRPIFLILLLPLFSFAQRTITDPIDSYPYAENAGLFDFSGTRFTGKVKLDTIYYKDGGIREIGSFAMYAGGNVSSRKVGKWTGFYPDGNIKSHGTYELGLVYGCRSATLHAVFYTYKSGEWIYFYNSGKIRAKGVYDIQQVPEGTIEGQSIKKGVINTTWVLLDENNNPLKAEGNIKEELEGN